MKNLQDLTVGKAFLNMAEKALTIKENKCNYTKIMNFYYPIENTKRKNRQGTVWENIHLHI